MANTGAMIAFYPSADIAANLAQATAFVSSTPEPADTLHCTLVYLGEAASIETQKQSLIDIIREYAADSLPVSGDINGIGRFFNGEDAHAVYANFDAPALPDFRQMLVMLAQAAGIQPLLNHGFTPHITLAYVAPTDPTPSLLIQPIPVTFDAVCIAWGDERYTFPLGGSATEEYAPMTDVGMTGNFVVTKQANGRYRWTATSSNNVKDRHREIVSRAALELDCYRTKQYGDDSLLYLYHIPFALGGAPDFRAVVDGFLIETGEFYPTEIAESVAKYIQKYPNAPDGSGWGVSIGFKGNPDRAGVYEVIRIKERSILPLSGAANSITQFHVTEVNPMPLNEKQLELLQQMADDPEVRAAAQAIFAAGDKNKQVDQAGLQRKSAGGFFANLFNAPGRYEAKPQDETVTKAADADPVATTTQIDQTVQKTEGTLTSTTAPADGADKTKAEDTTSSAPVLSDTDVQQLATYIDGRIEAAMSQVHETVEKMALDVRKMLDVVEDQETVKAVNTQSGQTLADRLKSISASRSDKTKIEKDDELVTKGKLPEVPEGTKTVAARHGFVLPSTTN